MLEWTIYIYFAPEHLRSPQTGGHESSSSDRGDLKKGEIKGTVGVISSDSPGKEGNARFTTVPLKDLCVRVVQRYVSKRIEIHLYISCKFRRALHWVQIVWKGYKVTVVNQALPSLYGGHLKLSSCSTFEFTADGKIQLKIFLIDPVQNGMYMYLTLLFNMADTREMDQLCTTSQVSNITRETKSSCISFDTFFKIK